ncbi:ATP-binding protein [Leptospira sp. FAT2]|uniref:AlbA family DNA-binding domain-containing protein n=1 Tax=Leptospira sanjuanensis TaxID=2879643 RepID=UPI001EE7C7EB|nr:RNA-binding domain-containing protein [Leptospira sanjuanensis]MCG6195602.1 ATP-binding protein [Leptospira sanjuanensis]
MDKDTFETLLNKPESELLDFKSQQYVFVNAVPYVKSELLKDILALSNSTANGTAYILIGVNDSEGFPKEVVGIDETLDDSDIQQFINSKINKPLKFLYYTFEYNGLRVGIIEIPHQEPPFYIIKDYGSLERLRVYIR